MDIKELLALNIAINQNTKAKLGPGWKILLDSAEKGIHIKGFHGIAYINDMTSELVLVFEGISDHPLKVGNIFDQDSISSKAIPNQFTNGAWQFLHCILGYLEYVYGNMSKKLSVYTSGFGSGAILSDLSTTFLDMFFHEKYAVKAVNFNNYGSRAAVEKWVECVNQKSIEKQIQYKIKETKYIQINPKSALPKSDDLQTGVVKLVKVECLDTSIACKTANFLESIWLQSVSEGITFERIENWAQINMDLLTHSPLIEVILNTESELAPNYLD